jgi:5'-nucleotidase/UDP-sugar diphosphatase
VKELGPVVTLGDLKACFPYDDSLTKYTITGEQLKRIFGHVMRIENRDGEGECYQVNGHVRAVYSDKEKKLISLIIDGKPVNEKQQYTVTMQGYHFSNSKAYLNLTNEELMALPRHIRYLKNGLEIIRMRTGRLKEDWYIKNSVVKT